jgi:hypothetical protein
MYGGMEVQLHTFLSSAPDGVGGGWVGPRNNLDSVVATRKKPAEDHNLIVQVVQKYFPLRFVKNSQYWERFQSKTVALNEIYYLTLR